MESILLLACQGTAAVAALVYAMHNLDRRLCSSCQTFSVSHGLGPFAYAKPNDNDSRLLTLEEFGASFAVREGFLPSASLTTKRSSPPASTGLDAEPNGFCCADDRVTYIWVDERIAQLAETRAGCLLSQPLRLQDALASTDGSHYRQRPLLALHPSAMATERGQTLRVSLDKYSSGRSHG